MLTARLEKKPIRWSVLKETQDGQGEGWIVPAEEAHENDPVVRMSTKIGVICGNLTCYEPLGRIEIGCQPVPFGLVPYQGSHELRAHFQPRYGFVPRKYDEEGRQVDAYDRKRKRQLGKQARNIDVPAPGVEWHLPSRVRKAAGRGYPATHRRGVSVIMFPPDLPARLTFTCPGCSLHIAVTPDLMDEAKAKAQEAIPGYAPPATRTPLASPQRLC